MLARVAANGGVGVEKRSNAEGGTEKTFRGCDDPVIMRQCIVADTQGHVAGILFPCDASEAKRKGAVKQAHREFQMDKRSCVHL